MKLRTSRLLTVIAAVAVMAAWVTNSSATIIASGHLRMQDGTLIVTSGSGWSNVDLTWSVDQTGNMFTYTYVFNSYQGTTAQLSHMTIEVSPNFTAADLLSGTTAGASVGNDGAAPRPDGTTTPLYGVKWQVDGSSFTGIIVTNRMPVWGDLYLKDGTVSAANSGYFLSDPTAPVTGLDINGYAWLATPDTAVPIPAAAWLLGSGLLGLVMIRRRFRK